jgi:hypothetical protein
MTAESLARVMEEFLGGSRNAVVVEDGARVFDLNESKYSISGEYNKCLLHLWSSERNVVRRILDSEVRNGNLRLIVQKLGSRVRRSWRSARATITARPQPDGRRGRLIRCTCDGRSKGTFPTSP